MAMQTSRLKELELENTQFKRMTESELKLQIIKDALAKNF